MESLFSFLFSLFAILISCIIFSNSVEWLGAKLNLSHGITGSVLAAVGTALPETMVPLVAIFWGVDRETLVKVLLGKQDSLNSLNQISIGAIIGAPFMLCTVAFFLIGFSSWLYYKSGRRVTKTIKVDETVLERDLTFFIISFSLAFLAIFLNHFLRVVLALALVLLYALYLYKTLKEEAAGEYKGEELEENLDTFFISIIFKKVKPTIFLISLQLVFSLCLLVISAHSFVEIIKDISHGLNFPPFIVSLLLTPIATELPEKFNSWMWIRQNKDTLAVGNISGALVFQSTFPVAIGLLFTSWKTGLFISHLTFIFCLLIAMIALYSLKRKTLTHKTFLIGGVFYIFYIAAVFLTNR